MIHSVRVTRDAGEGINILNDEAKEPSDRATSVTVVAEQHFAIRIYEDESGFALVRFRAGGKETDPILVSELVHRFIR